MGDRPLPTLRGIGYAGLFVPDPARVASFLSRVLGLEGLYGVEGKSLSAGGHDLLALHPGRSGRAVVGFLVDDLDGWIRGLEGSPAVARGPIFETDLYRWQHFVGPDDFEFELVQHRRSRSIRPGVGMVVRDGAGRVLLHRRAESGLWAVPSGHVEYGEKIADAARRELQEEAGIEVLIEALTGIYSDPQLQVVELGGGARTHFITSVFSCRLLRESDGPEAGDSEWDWRPPGSLPSDLTPYAQVWLEDALAYEGRPAVR